jgi:hypothetical protein
MHDRRRRNPFKLAANVAVCFITEKRRISVLKPGFIATAFLPRLCWSLR